MKKLRVLLVDDEIMIREGFKRLFDWEAHDCEVVGEAADGMEALAKIDTLRPDIAIMDINIPIMNGLKVIQMPVMNGYDAVRAIRAMNRNYCKKIPIVAMTANAFAEDVLAAKTVGMNEHIAKPLDLKNLARTLNRWLR